LKVDVSGNREDLRWEEGMGRTPIGAGDRISLFIPLADGAVPPRWRRWRGSCPKRRLRKSPGQQTSYRNGFLEKELDRVRIPRAGLQHSL
jgi:hypothetical protein